MSGTWPVFLGPIPDIAKRCPEYGQKEIIDVWNRASGVRNRASDVRNRTSDVRNMASDVPNMTRK